MKPSPLKLGIVGAFAYFVSVAWVLVYFRVVSRNNPAGWIVDRTTPDVPKFVAMVGVGCVLLSIVWAIVRLIRRRVHERKRRLRQLGLPEYRVPVINLRP